MSTLNTQNKSSVKRTRTYQGAVAHIPKPLIELRRAVLSCFLWESSFYESGNDLANRISLLIDKVSTEELCDLAIEARHIMNLRHVPLFLAVEMLKNPKHKSSVRQIIPKITNRPDDLSELLAIYWKDGKTSIPHQLKAGIADKLKTFKEYQLAKYQNKGGIKLRDLFNLTHPRPQNKEQEKLWKTLMTTGLPSPETWEVKISTEGNNKQNWEELLKKNKLGSMALLRNLRNMNDKSVDKKLIEESLLNANYERVLPFRFIAAAKYCPSLEPIIEKALFNRLESYPKLTGKTGVLVDVSGSMGWRLSEKSDMDRIDAGCGMAIILRELCEDIEVCAFHNNIYHLPPRHGFALRDAIRSVGSGGTYLGGAIKAMEERFNLDRLIVFTDEQSHDVVPQPEAEKAYMINVSGYKPQVSFGKWISISGFSEKIIDFISMSEEL